MSRRIAFILSIIKLSLLGSLFIIICGAIILTVYGLLAKGYDLNKLGQLPLSSIVYDRNGNEIGKIHGAKSRFVPLDQVSNNFLKALIAREDIRFYEHNGIDSVGVVRATYRNIFKNKREGASTITMQLARNSFNELMNQKTLHRKLIEIMLARRIEKEYTKDQILEFYINRIFFGSGIYGIEKASLSYFGKKAKDMSLSEGAMLAGIIRGPNRFSPFRNIEGANKERKTVLRRMLDEGIITIDDYQNSMNNEVRVLKQKKSYKEQVDSYPMDTIGKDLNNALSVSNAEDGGLKIYTSIDLRLQKAIENALEKGLQSVERKAGYIHQTREQYINKISKGSTGYLQGAVILMDNKTGGLLAIVGGRSMNDSKFNRAINAKRPLGSIFKPFVYNTAFEKGLMPGSLISDQAIEQGEIKHSNISWTPKNHDNRSYGFQSADFGLYKSRNTMSVRVGKIAGIENIKITAEKVGIKILDSNPQIFLGNIESDLRTITSAYTVFPNYGRRAPPFTILSIQNSTGETFYRSAAQTYQAVPTNASVMTCMALEKVMSKEGTGARARTLGYAKQAGGKTGTTNDSKDTWFIGFSSKVTCGIWVGFDQPKTIHTNAYGSNIALPIWTAIMKECEKLGYAGGQLVPPVPMAEFNLCRTTGKIASSECVQNQNHYLDKIPYDSKPRLQCLGHRHLILGKNPEKKQKGLKVLKRLFQPN